jgi:hypothetical protein
MCLALSVSEGLGLLPPDTAWARARALLGEQVAYLVQLGHCVVELRAGGSIRR